MVGGLLFSSLLIPLYFQNILCQTNLPTGVSCSQCSCKEGDLVTTAKGGQSWALIEVNGEKRCFCCASAIDAKVRSGLNLPEGRGRFFGDMNHVCESLTMNEAHCQARVARDCNYEAVYFRDAYVGCFLCRPRCSGEQECQDLGRICGVVNRAQPVRSCTGSGSGYIPGRDNPREYNHALRTNYANFFHYLTPGFQIYGVSLKADKNYKPGHQNAPPKPFSVEETLKKPENLGNSETLLVVNNNHKRVSFKNGNRKFNKNKVNVITFEEIPKETSTEAGVKIVAKVDKDEQVVGTSTTTASTTTTTVTTTTTEEHPPMVQSEQQDNKHIDGFGKPVKIDVEISGINGNDEILISADKKVQKAR